MLGRMKPLRYCSTEVCRANAKNNPKILWLSRHIIQITYAYTSLAPPKHTHTRIQHFYNRYMNEVKLKHQLDKWHTFQNIIILLYILNKKQWNGVKSCMHGGTFINWFREKWSKKKLLCFKISNFYKKSPGLRPPIRQWIA